MKLNQNTLNKIIDLSRRLDAETAKRHPPGQPVALHELEAEDLEATSTETELSAVIEPLSIEEKAELEALYWLGRGDFDDFKRAKAHALKQDPANAHIYVTEKIGLGDVIREDALKLSRSGQTSRYGRLRIEPSESSAMAEQPNRFWRGSQAPRVSQSLESARV